MSDQKSGVLAIIIDRPMCHECIAEGTGLTPIEVAARLEILTDSLMVYTGFDRCRACGEIRDVCSVKG